MGEREKGGDRVRGQTTHRNKGRNGIACFIGQRTGGAGEDRGRKAREGEGSLRTLAGNCIMQFNRAREREGKGGVCNHNRQSACYCMCVCVGVQVWHVGVAGVRLKDLRAIHSSLLHVQQ